MFSKYLFRLDIFNKHIYIDNYVVVLTFLSLST